MQAPLEIQLVLRVWLRYVPAGDSCRVWRYFESVPEDMASMRTHEAAAVADRHLRSAALCSLYSQGLLTIGCVVRTL